MKVSMLLLLQLGSGAQAGAQNPAGAPLPILRPTLVSLGTPADSGGRERGGAALSPNGRLVVHNGCTPGPDVCVWNTLTHVESVIVTGPVHVYTIGPKGDQIVLRTDPGPLRYRGEEVGREAGIWTVHIDSMSGEVLEPPHLVAKVSANHGAFLSPDQATIAFMQSYGSTYVSSISVVPASGGTPRMVASGIEVHEVRWSADGSTLFYNAFVNSLTPTRARYRVPVTGGAAQLIEEQHLVTHEVGWDVRDPVTGKTAATMGTPSGVQVTDLSELFPGHEALAGIRSVRPRGVRVLDLSDGSARELVEPAMEVVGAPEWFGGDRVAVITRQDGKLELLTTQADGGNARSYDLSGVSSADQLHVSPDAGSVAFLGRRGGFGTIELLDLASGRQRMLVKIPFEFGDGSSPEGRGIGSIVWSKDSKKVLYLADIWTGTPAVHEVTLSGADRLLRPLPTFIYGPPPVFFPSARNPEFVEFAGGGMTVSLVPIGDGPPRVVFPLRSLGGPLSPDGRTLAVQTRQNGRPPIQVTLVAIDGSPDSNLSLPFFAVRVIGWHPDGQRLYVLGRDQAGEPFNVYAVPVSGDAPSVVARLASAREEALAVSADGRFVAVTVTGTTRVEFVKLRYDVSKVFPSAPKR